MDFRLKISDLTLVIAVLASLSTCRAPNPETSNSSPHFIVHTPGVSGLISKVKQNVITICLSGAISGQEQNWQDNIKSVVLKWVQPLRELTSAPLASDVNVVMEGASRCDGRVRVIANYNQAETFISDTPTTNMAATGNFSTYNILLHEFGHSFALGDTYQAGQNGQPGRSGNCKPGQPQAVMCNTSFGDLQTDDIAGVQKIFKEKYPNDVPGSNNPQNPSDVELFASIGADSRSLQFSLVRAGSLVRGAVNFCLGDAATCNAQEDAAWLTANASARQGIFTTNDGINISAESFITIRGQIAGSTNSTQRTIGFAPR